MLNTLDQYQLEPIERTNKVHSETLAVRGPLHSESRWRGGRTAKSGYHCSFRVDASAAASAASAAAAITAAATAR